MVRRRLYLVELFAGSHSVSRCVKRRFRSDCEVQILPVGMEETFAPNIVVDINTWRFKDDVDRFIEGRRPQDVVACWASPPCTEHSCAKTFGVRDIKQAHDIVLSIIEIIDIVIDRILH